LPPTLPPGRKAESLRLCYAGFVHDDLRIKLPVVAEAHFPLCFWFSGTLTVASQIAVLPSTSLPS
jgi:hypothetical protein